MHHTEILSSLYLQLDSRKMHRITRLLLKSVRQSIILLHIPLKL